MDRPRRPAAAAAGHPGRAPLRPPVRARRLRRRVRRRDGPEPAPVDARRAAGARGAGVAHPPGRDRRRREDGRRRGAGHPAHPRACWPPWRPTPAWPRPTRARLAVGAVFLPADPAAGAAARRILDEALAAEGLRRPGLAARAGRPVRARARGRRVRARHPPRARRPPGRRWARPASTAPSSSPGGPPRPPRRRPPGSRASTSPRSRGGRSSTRASSSAASSAASTATSASGAVRVPYAVFHQRYSTNTHPVVGPRPAVPAGRPQRRDQHRAGQPRGDARAARPAWAAARWAGASARWRARGGRSSTRPGSDSTSLDEALELLLAAGWPIDAAVMALLPEALDLRDEAVPGLAAWQAAAVARVEPWDGPAALVFSDGRRVGCVLDRNGLRPAAFEVRRDGLVVCGSEAGMLPVDAGAGRPARAPRPRRAARGRHGRGPDPGGRRGEAGGDRRRAGAAPRAAAAASRAGGSDGAGPRDGRARTPTRRAGARSSSGSTPSSSG